VPPSRPSSSLVFYLPYALPSSVSRKSFGCHSYENTGGVGVFFPFWNALTPSESGGHSANLRVLSVSALSFSVLRLSTVNCRLPFPLRYTIRSIWGTHMPTREDGWKLLCEYTASESLRKHMLAVEACVRAYARKAAADEETWGLAALLHDFDYERWPNHGHSPDEGHPSEGAKILRELGYPEEVIRAILSHANYCNFPRLTPLEHTLFACDELAGFLTACAYVRPSKSILDLEVDSVKRRMKDKLFAKGVSREDVRKGAEELGVPLEEHIGFCIAALREHADALGLRGTL